MQTPEELGSSGVKEHQATHNDDMSVPAQHTPCVHRVLSGKKDKRRGDVVEDDDRSDDTGKVVQVLENRWGLTSSREDEWPNILPDETSGSGDKASHEESKVIAAGNSVLVTIISISLQQNEGKRSYPECTGEESNHAT